MAVMQGAHHIWNRNIAVLLQGRITVN